MSQLRLGFVLVLGLALVACGGDDGGSGDPDAGSVCTNDTTMCVGNTFETCAGGAWVVTSQCSALCDNDLGCISCNPDTIFCENDQVMQCNGAGTGSSVSETCEGGAHCLGGACVDLCADAAENRSYIGCEYFAIDLDNAVEIFDNQLPGFFTCADNAPGAVAATAVKVCWDGSASGGLCDPGDTCPAGYTCSSGHSEVCMLDAAHSPFAVVVSNPQVFAVNVTITNATGTTQSISVPAGQVSSIFPQMMGFTDSSIDHSMQAKNAYRIVADAPIVAYQFNPLNNVDVFSNDASLLLPTTTWDADYYVMTWPTEDRRSGTPTTNNYNGYVTIVAAQDDTLIEVTTTAATVANGTTTAVAAATPTQYTLDAYEVLSLEAVANGDLTGTRVRSIDATPKPIGVFGGAEAVGIAQSPAPNPSYPSGPCCADHIEEMLFPTSTWGKTFAIARSQVRNMDKDHLRVIAQVDGTDVVFTPAATAVSTNDCTGLMAGEWCEVKVAVDTKAEATQPVLIAKYLESAIWSNGNPLVPMSMGSGDPSMSIVVPAEQFRDEYTILVPSQYDMSYVSISTPMNGTVRIDGNDVTSTLTVFATDYKAGRSLVTAGQHVITCTAGCGIEIMGYSEAVSYLFAGGLDLRQIVVD